MEIQRADRERRRQALTTLVVVAAVGAVGMLLLEDWLASLDALPVAEARAALLVAMAWTQAGAGLLLVGLAAWLWRFGAQVLVAGRFPPPGIRVIRDTFVLLGDAARRRGRLLQAAAVTLVLCTVALVLLAWRLHQSLAAVAS